jgi:hypothetical protein
MFKNPFYLIIFLALYLPIEDFMLKWLPVSEQAYILLRQIPDVLIIFMALIIFVKKALTNGSIIFIGKKTDFYLLLFLIVAIISIPLNQANVFVSLANIKALLRYVFLIYLILMIKPSEKDVITFWKAIKIGIAVQILIGIMQYIGGYPIRDFLAARNTTADIGGFFMNFTGDRFADRNDLFGTMGNTINYGMFLIVGMIYWMVGKNKSIVKYWAGVSILLLLIYLTGSRSTIITGLFVLWLHQFYIHFLQGIKISIVGIIILPLIIIAYFAITQLILNDNNDFLYMFTNSYIKEAMRQRLGIVVHILPEYFSNIGAYLGYSADKEVFVSFVSQNMPMVPDMLIKVLPGVLEDVYWVALLFYYGVIGFLLFFLFYFSILKMNIFIYKNRYPSIVNKLALMNILLLLACLPLNMFNQAFEVRQFSFYIWVSVGLALSLMKQNDTNKTKLYENTAN